MTLQKKLLASAIVAGMAISANAYADINLGDDPMVYASEIKAGTSVVTTNDDIGFEVGYNFSAGEVRNGRFECTDNMTLSNVVLPGTSSDGHVALGSVNGEGTSALFFSMTGDGTASSAGTIAVASDNKLLDGADVQCAFSIYDQPSQAQAGGETGRIYTSGWETVITRESGFVFQMDPSGATQAVADVEAQDGSYFDFDYNVGSGAYFGNLEFDAASGVLNTAGTQISLADIFTSDTYFTVDGDFSASDPDSCGVYYGSWGCADDSADDQYIFAVGNFPEQGDLEFYALGDVAIPESEYTATLHADTNAPYVVADVGPVHVGEIVRNGTQLQAPLAQVPGAGWLSRMVLTNTGSVDRAYAINVSGETGNTIGTENTTGVVPANGTVVVDLTTVMTSFTAGKQRRGTLNVTVAAPTNQIQGLYQIVNANSGSISNHVMVRPGTN
jgi:hypothetical protein